MQNQEYIGYDSLGRLLQLTTDGRSIQISLSENQPNHANELTNKLRTYLVAVHDSIANDSNYDLPGFPV